MFELRQTAPTVTEVDGCSTGFLEIKRRLGKTMGGRQMISSGPNLGTGGLAGLTNPQRPETATRSVQVEQRSSRHAKGRWWGSWQYCNPQRELRNLRRTMAEIASKTQEMAQLDVDDATLKADTCLIGLCRSTWRRRAICSHAGYFATKIFRGMNPFSPNFSLASESSQVWPLLLMSNEHCRATWNGENVRMPFSHPLVASRPRYTSTTSLASP